MKFFQIELPENLLQILKDVVDEAMFKGKESEQISVLKICLRNAKEIPEGSLPTQFLSLAVSCFNQDKVPTKIDTDKD
jgi:hypothetical protein